jgi:NTP pyrophosphatase (non-canonical NTP hydrolase)
VDVNVITEQLCHLESELDEIDSAIYRAGSGNDTYEHVAEEVADLMQSCATMLYILREQHGVNLDETVKRVQEKNRDRGYEG